MQDLISQVPAVIFEFAASRDGVQRFTRISDSCRDMLGMSPCELSADARLLFDRVHPDDLSELKQALNQAAKDGNIRRWSGRLVGGHVPKRVEFRFRSEEQMNGVIISRGVILEEAPERVKAVHQKSGYDQLLERLPIGVVIYRGDAIMFANRHASKILGAADAGQLVGMKKSGFFPGEGCNSVPATRGVSGAAEAPLVETSCVRLDGTAIEVEMLSFDIEYRRSLATQVIFRDITEKKKHEARARRSESMFLQLFQNLPMAVAMLDESGKVTAVNRGFEEMFGYQKAELVGKNLNDFIVPDGLHDEGMGLNNLIASNQVVTLESVRKHRSGRMVNVILCGVPVLFENKTIGIFGLYFDITDRKRVEEELKVRNAELDNFVYKVSHDLRAPLSSVLGLVNLSQMEGNTDNPVEYIRIIGEKIKALDNFIGDVLSHSKNLKMEVSTSRVDIAKVIDQTFLELSYLEGAQQIKRSVKVEGIDFYSDEWRISEIFRNLVSNAIKYRKVDCPEPEVTIRVIVDHLCADIDFADNGIGIKPGSLKRIFEMFYRATEQAEGSGIGLYIVRNAIEKLGGQIKVASAPGHGTRFHILLPNRINSVLNASQISEGER